MNAEEKAEIAELLAEYGRLQNRKVDVICRLRELFQPLYTTRESFERDRKSIKEQIICGFKEEEKQVYFTHQQNKGQRSPEQKALKKDKDSVNKKANRWFESLGDKIFGKEEYENDEDNYNSDVSNVSDVSTISNAVSDADEEDEDKKQDVEEDALALLNADSQQSNFSEFEMGIVENYNTKTERNIITKREGDRKFNFCVRCDEEIDDSGDICHTEDCCYNASTRGSDDEDEVSEYEPSENNDITNNEDDEDDDYEKDDFEEVIERKFKNIKIEDDDDYKEDIQQLTERKSVSRFQYALPLKDRTPQLYQTPENAILPLFELDFLQPFKDKIIFEPCCGHHAITKVLKNNGFTNVVERDKFFPVEGITHDFLDEDEPLPEFDIIITNPPYGKEKHLFLEKCFRLKKPFALLLPIQTIQTEKSKHILYDNGFAMAIFTRPPKFHKALTDEIVSVQETCWLFGNFDNITGGTGKGVFYYLQN